MNTIANEADLSAQDASPFAFHAYPSLGAALKTLAHPSVRTDCLLLFSIGIVLYFAQIFTLEFFRHTEADRALIAWEMNDTGSYLVPHLLGFEILTKPPLFYWALAGSAKLFGEMTEFAARFPSSCAALLFIISHYLLTLLAGANRTFALGSSLILGTMMLFLNLANIAEIDMTFGFLCGLSSATLYLGLSYGSSPAIVLSYFIVAVATLTKGPPALAFFGVGLLGYVLYTRSLPKFSAHVVGAFLCTALIGGWLSLLAARVGWSALYEQFNTEIVQRVMEDRHRRGPFYYFQAAFLGFSPWSLLGIAGILIALKEKRLTLLLRSEPFRGFIFFFLATFICGFLLLSFASGKTTRYMFPLAGSAAHILTLGVFLLGTSRFIQPVRKYGAYFLGFLACVALVLPLFLKFQGVSTAFLFFAAVLFVPFLTYAAYCLYTGPLRKAFIAIVVIMFGVRLEERLVYAKHQNAIRLESAIAQHIHEMVPLGIPLYTVEAYERWMIFYLRKLNREVYQLHTPMLARLREYDGSVYLLLNYDLEAWRIAQLNLHGTPPRSVREIKMGREHLLLAEVSKEALSNLTLRPLYPTVPSAPFYGEPLSKGAVTLSQTED